MRSLPIIAAIIVAVLPATAVAQTFPASPYIEVNGSGEVETPPDTAIVKFSLRGEGRTSDDAVRNMVASGKAIFAALAALDPAAIPTTDKVEAQGARGQQCNERSNYDDKQISTGICAIVGFVASQEITVRTHKVKEAGTMVGIASRGGAFNSQLDSFTLQDPTAAERLAIEKAIVDAGNSAAAVAAGSGVKLGPLMKVTTVGGRQSQDIVITGSRIAQGNAPPPAPVTVDITPTPIKTQMSVTVIYAIAR